MQLRKILFATDFSEGSDAALAMASSLARDNGARLLILHVHEPAIVYGEGLAAAYAGLPEEQRADVRRILDTVQPTLPGIEFEHRLVTGLPAETIVESARQDSDVDLIVLGTHGRTGLSRLLMGSVAENVVRRAPCPVLTVKKPREEQPKDSA
jgi:nucleotide-binding universal stress UspA family protein